MELNGHLFKYFHLRLMETFVKNIHFCTLRNLRSLSICRRHYTIRSLWRCIRLRPCIFYTSYFRGLQDPVHSFLTTILYNISIDNINFKEVLFICLPYYKRFWFLNILTVSNSAIELCISLIILMLILFQHIHIKVITPECFTKVFLYPNRKCPLSC